MKITFNQDYKKIGASYKSKAYHWVLPSIKDNRKIDENNDEVVEEINSSVENKTVNDLIADIEKLVAVTDCACIVEIEKKLNQCIAKNTNLSACIERIKQLPNEVDVIIDSTNSKDCIILEKLQAGSVEFDELLLTQYQLLHQKFVEEYENLTKYIAAVDSDIKKLQIEKQNCSRKCIHARHKIKCTKEQLMCMDDYLKFGQCGAGGNSILDNCRMLEKLKAMIQ